MPNGAFLARQGNMEEKTNVHRTLDAKKISYTTYSYPPDASLSGAEVAELLGQDPKKVFKTLVTRAKSGKFYVFMVPVEKSLNLKKAAKAVGEKSVEMIQQKELFPLTGYVHGGCSPIGMKKLFPTVIDASCQNLDTIIFSAGKIGKQVELNLPDFKKTIKVIEYDVID